MAIFTDAATVATVTQVLVTESADIVDSDTPTSISVVTSVEFGPLNDMATITTVATITVGEYSFTHPTGSWGIFDTDDGII